jgi:hypothetical protein
VRCFTLYQIAEIEEIAKKVLKRGDFELPTEKTLEKTELISFQDSFCTSVGFFAQFAVHFLYYLAWFQGSEI